jgi:hypothetical protein
MTPAGTPTGPVAGGAFNSISRSKKLGDLKTCSDIILAPSLATQKLSYKYLKKTKNFKYHSRLPEE